MTTIATVLLGALALYVLVGLAIGAAFVAYGITIVQSAPVTVGARILLLPGAIIFWPLVLSRWLSSSRRP